MNKYLFLSIIALFSLTSNVSTAQFGSIIKKAKKEVKKASKESTSSKNEKSEKNEVESKEPATKKETSSNSDKSVNESKTNESSKTETSSTQKVEKKEEKSNQADEEEINKKHVEAVRYFLIATSDFTTGESFTTFREPSYYTKMYEVDLKEAIYVINTKEFEGSILLKEYFDNLKNPKYSEIRYSLTDQIYKNQIRDREMYPNKDRSDISKQPLQIRYELLQFIGKYMLKNDPNILDEASYTKKKIDKINAKFEADLNAVAINDVHKANLYKVVFTSNRNINPETAPASEYKTSFEPGEEIFAVAMVDKPLNKNLVKGAYPELFMTTGFNDYVKTVIEYDMFPVKPNQKYFIFPIVVKSSNFQCSNTEATANTEYAMRWLSKKEDRRFTIKVQLKEGNDFHNSSGSLEGRFTYNASDISGDILKKMANQIAAKCGRE